MSERERANERAALRRELELLDREARLLDDEATASGLLRALPANVLRVTPEGRIRWLNVFGEVSDEVLARIDLFAFVAPEDAALVREIFREVGTRGGSRGYESSGLDRLGLPHRYTTRVAAIPGAGPPYDLVVVSVEADELALAEAQLRRTELLLRLAKDVSGVGAWSVDPETGRITWDDVLRNMWDGPPPATVAEFLEAIPDEDRAAVIERGRKALDDGVTLPTIVRVRSTVGIVRTLFTCGVAIVGATGRPQRIVGGAVDLTLRRELEERVALAQRLGTIATITTGLARALDARVEVLLGHLHALARGPLDAAARANLDAAIDAGGRAAALVAQLRLISGQGPSLARRDAAPAALASRVRGLAAATCPETVTLREHVDAHTPDRVAIDVDQLEQALLNLVLNARDALAGRRGAIWLHVGPRPARAGDGRPAAVRFVVADDGPGMDPETLARALEPFFTTKPEGQGTGLGLATVYAIVRAHGGVLELESQVGRGTTVTIDLPIAAGVELHGEAV